MTVPAWAGRILHGFLICSILMLGSVGDAGVSGVDCAPADKSLVLATSDIRCAGGEKLVPIEPAPSAALAQRCGWDCSGFEVTRQSKPRVAVRQEGWLRELRSVVLLR